MGRPVLNAGQHARTREGAANDRLSGFIELEAGAADGSLTHQEEGGSRCSLQELRALHTPVIEAGRALLKDETGRAESQLVSRLEGPTLLVVNDECAI